MRMTYVISARHRGPVFADQVDAQVGMPRSCYKVTEPMLASGVDAADLQLSTDDSAPVERLLAALFPEREGSIRRGYGQVRRVSRRPGAATTARPLER